MTQEEMKSSAPVIVARLSKKFGGGRIALLFKTDKPYEHYAEDGEEVPYDAIESWQEVNLSEPVESEDERVREELIKLVRDSMADNAPYKAKMLAYLEKQKEQNGDAEECTDFTIYHPLKNGKGEYECIPYSFYGSLTSFSEDKDLIDFLHTCFYTEEECEEWIETQKEQKPLLPEDKVKHPLYVEGFEAGKEVGRQCEKVFEKQKEKKPEQYSPLCNTIKDKIREYIANHFIADTVVKTDMRSIVKAMEEGVRLGKEEQKPAEIDEYEIIKKHITRDSLSSEVNKRLKECGWYVTDEKPAEWSEEDKRNLTDAISTIEHLKNDCDWGYLGIGNDIDNVLNFLESLPERFNLQSSWKPSEEQIEALESAVKLYKDTHFEIHHKNIVSLYEQLKKLM